MKRDCRSPKLAASTARNGPPDHSARLRRAVPDRFDDLFHDFGRIAVRRMFGGEGIFVGELMIGIVVDDQIYLKVGDANRADFEAEGAKPFTYTRGKERNATSLSYYTVPDRLLDDTEEFAPWARKAHEVALAARAAKGKKHKR
ncbi:MAG TPA: TfoX/Sxy family protein [Rhizomicrobium sp.]|nr:TfoX/Sxy family protein [Rhizomicrobium sp.]